MSEVE
jgi:hypothetical protein